MATICCTLGWCQPNLAYNKMGHVQASLAEKGAPGRPRWNRGEVAEKLEHATRELSEMRGEIEIAKELGVPRTTLRHGKARWNQLEKDSAKVVKALGSGLDSCPTALENHVFFSGNQTVTSGMGRSRIKT